jgi:hypothetical protein
MALAVGMAATISWQVEVGRELVRLALVQSWGLAEKPPWPGSDQAAIPNRPATKVA